MQTTEPMRWWVLLQDCGAVATKTVEFFCFHPGSVPGPQVGAEGTTEDVLPEAAKERWFTSMLPSLSASSPPPSLLTPRTSTGCSASSALQAGGFAASKTICSWPHEHGRRSQNMHLNVRSINVHSAYLRWLFALYLICSLYTYIYCTYIRVGNLMCSVPLFLAHW